MKDRLKTLYINGVLTEVGIAAAVTKKWITQEEADEILASKNEE